MVGTGMGWSKARSSPGTSSRHPGCPGRQDLLHPWPGTGRKVPGEGDKVGAGTHHPRVTLRWDPVEAGTESLPGHMNVRVGRSQAPARGLTLKKKRFIYFKIFLFFFPSFFVVFTCISKKVGQKYKKSQLRNGKGLETTARNEPKRETRSTNQTPPTTRPNDYWNFRFPLYKTHQSMPRSGTGRAGREEDAGPAWLPAPAPGSRQVVLQAVQLPRLLLPFAALVLGRRRVVDVEGLLVLQAGFQRVLQLVGSAGIVLRERGGSGQGGDGGEPWHTNVPSPAQMVALGAPRGQGPTPPRLPEPAAPRAVPAWEPVPAPGTSPRPPRPRPLPSSLPSPATISQRRRRPQGLGLLRFSAYSRCRAAPGVPPELCPHAPAARRAPAVPHRGTMGAGPGAARKGPGAPGATWRGAEGRGHPRALSHRDRSLHLLGSDVRPVRSGRHWLHRCWTPKNPGALTLLTPPHPRSAASQAPPAEPSAPEGTGDVSEPGTEFIPRFICRQRGGAGPGASCPGYGC